MKKIIVYSSLTMFLVIMPFIIQFAFGQPDPGGGPTNPVGGAPIDGGLTLLLGAGIAYGVKKLYKKQNEYLK